MINVASFGFVERLSGLPDGGQLTGGVNHFFNIAIIFFFLCIVYVIAVEVPKSREKTKKDMEFFCSSNGFDYDPAFSSFELLKGGVSAAPAPEKKGFFKKLSLAGTGDSPLGFTGLEFFWEGQHRCAENLVLVPFKNGKLYFFDYGYSEVYRKGTRYFKIALMKVSSPLPEFALKPKGDGLLDKVFTDLGDAAKNLELPGRPEFSRKYFLLAREPEAAFAFLTEERTRVLEENSDWTVYAAGEYLALFNNRVCVTPENYRAYIDSAGDLLEALKV